MSAAGSNLGQRWAIRGWMALVIVAGLGLTLFAGWSARQRQLDFYHDQLTAVGTNIATDLEVQVHTAGGFVEALAAFFENSTEVTEAEFSAFVQSTGAKWPGMFASSWQCYVPANGRDAFEARMRAIGHPEFLSLIHI